MIKKQTTDKNGRVDLLSIAQVLNGPLEEGICEEVFKGLRTNQRERCWTFKALAQFWVAVILKAPQSLTQLLDASKEGSDPMLPKVDATPEAFFERSQDISWRFFAGLFQAFTKKVADETRPCYAVHLKGLRQRFPHVAAVDGSRLEDVARRLKILRRTQGAVLPGMMAAMFDCWSGMLMNVIFEPDAAHFEFSLAMDMAATLPRGSLVLGDRLYGIRGFFRDLSSRNLWGLARRHQAGGSVHKTELLSRFQAGGRAVIEDWLIEFGSPAAPPIQIMRMIIWRKGGSRIELLTNILDPSFLSGIEALELYRSRWGIERMFFELKVVLGLNRIYAGSPNAAGIQLYASAIVHTALKIAQAKIAAAHGVAPEDISTAKLFPRMAKACQNHAMTEWYWLRVLAANPGIDLIKPEIRGQRWAWTRLRNVLVESKSKPRSEKPPFNPNLPWRSFAHILGGEAYLKN